MGSKRYAGVFSIGFQASGFDACYACLLVLMIMPLPLWPYLMVIVQGFLDFGLASIYGAVRAEIFAGPKFSTIFILAGLGGNFGAGIGPWLTGYIFDNMGSYGIYFWLCIAEFLVSIFCKWIAAPRKVRLVAC